MIQVEHIFTTPLAGVFLNLDNTKLEEFCLAAVTTSSQTAEVFQENQSVFLDLTAPELQNLLEEVSNNLNAFYNTLDFNPNTRLKILRAWANTNNTHAIDVPHCHPDGIFTAIYYVKGTGSSDNGSLNLLTPVASLQHCMKPDYIAQNNRFNVWAWGVKPETGKLIMFPAWIMHSVARNKLPDRRISIAFDAVVEYYGN